MIRAVVLTIVATLALDALLAVAFLRGWRIVELFIDADTIHPF